MLTIGKLGAGQEGYYLDSVATGIEDYYTGEGEASGRWAGKGSPALGLDGRVEADELHHILCAEHPESGQPLTSRNQGRRVPGFDLTFSAPKSASLLWALGDEESRRVVRDCHDRAVEAALGYMEREAGRVRRGAGGLHKQPVQGLIAAAFRHRSSRAGDPQLHTHVLIANLAQGPDGRYSALDGQRIYHHAKSGGYLYQAHLRNELARELGVKFQPVRRGAAEVEGVPDEVIRGFSRRRAEIERAMAERGETSAHAAQVAALDTRRGKEYGVGEQTLHERWNERAFELGAEPASWGLGRPERSEIEMRQIALCVTADRSHFDRRGVVEAFCDSAPSGLSVEEAEHRADAFLASDEVVHLAPAQLGDRYTTPEILRLESGVVAGLERLKGVGAGVADDVAIARVISSRPTIGTDQAKMVRRLASDGDGLAIVVGRPGTGKTFALDAAAEAWRSAGLEVRGAAPTRVAALELERAAGIPSVSVAAILAEMDDRAANSFGAPALADGTVLVVDEAAMVGTRSTARLLHHVEAANGKLVLVGDHRQLPELEAGGLFASLSNRTHPIELTEVRRHDHALDRENVERVRQGRGGEAFELYRAEDRVVLTPDAESRREAMVADWWQSFQAGDQALMIAKRNSDVAELNALARELMRTVDRLGDREVEVAGQAFAAGDIVVTRVNARSGGVANRMRWTVGSVGKDGDLVVERLGDGHRAVLDREYLRQVNCQNGAPALQHGYAGTIYTAQGQSVDQAFIAAEAAMSLEEFNTSLSRSIGETHLYAVNAPEPKREEFAPLEQEPPDPLDELLRSMERPRAQVSAIDESERAVLRELPASELVSRHRKLRDQVQATELGGPGATAPDLEPSLVAVSEEIDERSRLAVTASRVCPPRYLIDAIGPRPEAPAERRHWERGLQDIERYRSLHLVSDSDRALGTQPPSEPERSAFHDAHTRLRGIRRDLAISHEAQALELPLEIEI